MVTLLVLVLLFFPYTSSLLLGHKLYGCSGRKYLRWLNRLQPLLDSYHAPYKPQARYWTGFLLVVRCALYIVFSFNSLGGTHRSLLAIIITFTTLGFFVGFVYGGRIYKTLSVNILEALSYLNLILLSAVVQVGNYFPLVYSLVGTELVILFAVIIYHFHILCAIKSTFFLKLKDVITQLKANRSQIQSPKLQTGTPSQDPHKIVTKAVIELREPLLDQ